MVSVRELGDDGELLIGERLNHQDRDTVRKILAAQPPGTPVATPVAMEAAFGLPWVAAWQHCMPSHAPLEVNTL